MLHDRITEHAKATYNKEKKDETSWYFVQVNEKMMSKIYLHNFI
jgi:hypothetical protein